MDRGNNCGPRECHTDVVSALPVGDEASTTCVAAAERGTGLAQAMFAELRRWLPAREGILFIRRDNVASLRAHQKMGMNEVGRFVFAGSEFAILSYIG
ncbi:MAG: family acetyltransferase [Schlesneria sp.]|nr:family acetyltransferase [Schlesneria sp.]